MRDPCYWAYTMQPEKVGRIARGFVLATSQSEAKAKAKKRIDHERRQFAKWVGVPIGDLRSGMKSNRYVKVWKDPDRSSTPSCKHYVERKRT